MKIVTAAQMNRIDRECALKGIAVSTLMDNAGKAVTVETRRALGVLDKQHILCLIGAGNNGGDGLVAARYLWELGARVSVYLCSSRPPDDANLKLVQERGIKCITAAQDKSLKKSQGLL